MVIQKQLKRYLYFIQTLISLLAMRFRQLRFTFLRQLRRFGYYAETLPPFLKIAFSSQGLASHNGRILIWGKFRRLFISLFPPYAKYLQNRYALHGGCISCGASCKLLFQCPHWNDTSHLCSIYEDRPNICRYFPMTPADIRDRDLVLKNSKCGFTFRNLGKKT